VSKRLRCGLSLHSIERCGSRTCLGLEFSVTQAGADFISVGVGARHWSFLALENFGAISTNDDLWVGVEF
jgi:hypothetical protein